MIRFTHVVVTVTTQWLSSWPKSITCAICGRSIAWIGSHQDYLCSEGLKNEPVKWNSRSVPVKFRSSTSVALKENFPGEFIVGNWSRPFQYIVPILRLNVCLDICNRVPSLIYLINIYYIALSYSIPLLVLTLI